MDVSFPKCEFLHVQQRPNSGKLNTEMTHGTGAGSLTKPNQSSITYYTWHDCIFHCTCKVHITQHNQRTFMPDSHSSMPNRTTVSSLNSPLLGLSAGGHLSAGPFKISLVAN